MQDSMAKHAGGEKAACTAATRVLVNSQKGLQCPDVCAPATPQITPPPGFGGPVSNEPTPTASQHTSIDSASQLGMEAAEAARRGAAPAAPLAAAEAQGQEGLPSLGGAPLAASGSLLNSVGSSSSLAERLPSAGDLLSMAGPPEVRR